MGTHDANTKSKDRYRYCKISICYAARIDGEDITIVSDEMQLFKDGHDTIDDNMLRLTDESAIDKMHFFDEHHEQLIRRIATLGGPFSTTAKVVKI